MFAHLPLLQEMLSPPTFVCDIWWQYGLNDLWSTQRCLFRQRKGVTLSRTVQVMLLQLIDLFALMFVFGLQFSAFIMAYCFVSICCFFFCVGKCSFISNSIDLFENFISDSWKPRLKFGFGVCNLKPSQKLHWNSMTFGFQPKKRALLSLSQITWHLKNRYLKSLKKEIPVFQPSFWGVLKGACQFPGVSWVVFLVVPSLTMAPWHLLPVWDPCLCSRHLRGTPFCHFLSTRLIESRVQWGLLRRCGVLED